MENYSNISKNFIPYDLALELKELGFDEECLAVYCSESEIRFRVLEKNTFINDKSSWVTAPLWQQVFDWFREKYNFNSWISGRKSMGYGYIVNNVPNRFKNNILDTLESPHIYDSHKKARLYCLEKLIEIAKEQNVK